MEAVVKEEKPRTKGAAEVAAFEKKYADALVDANISAEHTATEGWQQLYESHLKNMEKWRREIGAKLHDAATAIERGDTSDGPVETMSDAKKAFAGMCNVGKVFDARTVSPVKESVQRCREVIEAARRDARSAESNSPLIAKGILQAVEEAIGGVAKVEFDEKTGRVIVNAWAD